jgi:predicted heme/steroid binding protein
VRRTEGELLGKTGKDGGDIWISIMGEVYDVTSGRDFYGEGGPYSVFSGRDGSVPFITGVFTPEEAKKSLIDTLSAAQLVSLEQWRTFYADNEKYPLIGLLEGSLYDKDGNPTEELKTVRERIANFVPPEKKERPSATES